MIINGGTYITHTFPVKYRVKISRYLNSFPFSQQIDLLMHFIKSELLLFNGILSNGHF